MSGDTEDTQTAEDTSVDEKVTVQRWSASSRGGTDFVRANATLAALAALNPRALHF